MKHVQLALIGFGVVGQGFARLLSAKHNLLRQQYDLDISLVSVANARHGLIYREDGLDIQIVPHMIGFAQSPVFPASHRAGPRT